ncbi:hypothetical protein PENTCL1PPCAC_30057 [Pristionchus entomophagus]|uniref:Ankyrin repeat-containing protein n=1 Tax=Pristionchus entomophagus TaxID=358040 RepID=A0AAV5UNZ6_9BILA|nr:hypothetical protein PENTCL1PPCAC_30057 [Pristionchus entomophagus]
MGLKEPTAAQVELFDACKRGDTERVRQWLASKKNKRPRTPLNFLRPSTPNSSWICSIRDPNSAYTPLHLSALHGHSEISRLLLDADPHVTTAKDRRGCIPLHLASWSGHTNIAQLLTDFEPESVDVINNCGESSLHVASQCGYVKVVGILLDKHSDARLRNARFETALDLAAKNGHAPVVRILVNYCPELALQSAADCSMPQFGMKHMIVYPLHLAARKSHILCMQLLRFAGFDIDFATEEGSALHVAALHGEVEAVRFLLREGIKTDIRDSNGRTVLEALEEHESERSNDLTQVMSVKEKWRECRIIISEFIYAENGRRGTLSSSSDSGFDRRDQGDRRYTFDGAEDNVWQPVPDTASGLSPTSQHDRSLADHSRPFSHYSGSVRLQRSINADTPHNINRTWNSRLLRDAVNSEGRVVPRFPLTSPNTKARHQSSKRISDTLPLKFSVSRTSTAPSRSSILPGESCVYRAPPTYESLPGSRRPTLPANGYDNASNVRTWDHSCPGSSSDLCGGPDSYSAATRQSRRRYGETQTLPRGGLNIRERPTVLGSFPEEPSSSLERKRISTTDLLDAQRASVCSTSTFACSTLERPLSTPVRDESFGVAPLAEPEEMIASVSNSLVSTRGTPERAFSKASTPASWDHSAVSPLSERTLDACGPAISTTRNHSQDDLASLPSPNTSEMQISDALFASSEKSLPRRPRRQPDECHSPTATECSDRTVASSCSIPTVSNQSLTSLGSAKRIGGEDHNLDERAEWQKIDSIMQSIGVPMNESKRPEGGHQVMRDRHSKALTLLSTLNPRQNENTIDETVVDVARFQTDALERWFKLEVGLDAVDAATMALLLQRNGFDMVEHLQISLDRLALIEMGVKDSLIHQICHHLLTCPQLRKYPPTNELNYVSEWLQSLDLQNYLGNFFRCGLKTMIIVRTTDVTQRKLNDMGIHKIGHVLRLLHSLRNAKKMASTNVNANNRNSRLSLNEQLIAGWVAFSAHFLGSVEISNVNSADEARATMTRLKKALREIAKVPQIRIEISVSGVRLSDAATSRQEAFHEISQIKIVCQDERDLNCFTYITREDDRFFCHVLAVLTADVATEIVSALGQAFECAFEQQNELQTAKINREERSSVSRTIEC